MPARDVKSGSGFEARRQAFAYLSLTPDGRPNVEVRLRRALVDLAAAEGLELRSVFVDDRNGTPSRFWAMRELLRRGDVRVVLLPDLTHVAHIPAVAHLTRAGLGRWLNAAVLLAAAATPRPLTRSIR